MESMEQMLSVLTTDVCVEVIGGFCVYEGYDMVRDLVIRVDGDTNVDRLGELDLVKFEGFHKSLGDVLDRVIGEGAYESILYEGVSFSDEVFGKMAERVSDGFYEDLNVRYEGSSWDWAEVGDSVRIVDYKHYSLPEGVLEGEVCMVEEDYSGDILVKNRLGNFVIVPWENYTVMDRSKGV